MDTDGPRCFLLKPINKTDPCSNKVCYNDTKGKELFFWIDLLQLQELNVYFFQTLSSFQIFLVS